MVHTAIARMILGSNAHSSDPLCSLHWLHNQCMKFNLVSVAFKLFTEPIAFTYLASLITPHLPFRLLLSQGHQPNLNLEFHPLKHSHKIWNTSRQLWRSKEHLRFQILLAVLNCSVVLTLIIIIIIIFWFGDTVTVSHSTKCNTNTKVSWWIYLVFLIFYNKI